MAEPGNDPPALGFFAELRRRRVVRVAVVYAIAGWVVIEVASTMLPGLNLPGWTVTLVIALVVLGFPIAFMMGWMFDIGPRGVQRTAATTDVSAPATTTPTTTASESPLVERRAASRPTPIEAPPPPAPRGDFHPVPAQDKALPCSPPARRR